MWDRAEQEAAFALIRAAIAARLAGQAPPPLPPATPGLTRPAGAFVTLRVGGRLRGCIGYVRTSRPLAESLRDLAVQAAFEDRRFSPLTAGEVGEIELEVSVLTPPAPVDPGQLPDGVEVGRDGLIVRRGGRSGLLLPQVAVEQGWDAASFLAHTCRKAGLPSDAWCDPSAEVESFRCEVYEEPGGAT